MFHRNDSFVNQLSILKDLSYLKFVVMDNLTQEVKR